MGDLRPVRFEQHNGAVADDTRAVATMARGPGRPSSSNEALGLHSVRGYYVVLLLARRLHLETCGAYMQPYCGTRRVRGCAQVIGQPASHEKALRSRHWPFRFRESFLDSSKHLESIDPGPVGSHLDSQYACTRAANVWSDEFPSSYGPMALLELYATPPIPVASKFKTSMSFMRMIRTLRRAVVKHEADVQYRVDEERTPETRPCIKRSRSLSWTSSAHRECRCQ